MQGLHGDCGTAVPGLATGFQGAADVRARCTGLHWLGNSSLAFGAPCPAGLKLVAVNTKYLVRMHSKKYNKVGTVSGLTDAILRHENECDWNRIRR